MSELQCINEVLGGAQVLQNSPVDSDDAIRLLREGLPVEAVEAVRSRLGLSMKEMSQRVGISQSTLFRRHVLDRLKPEESNRLYRLARITAQAEQVFSNQDKAHQWLRRGNQALKGQAPIDLLDTDVGIREVEDVLARIAYGVYG